MNRLSVVAITGLSAVSLVFGQAKPFPQAADYAHGYRSTTVTSADALATYNLWKSQWLSRDCSGKLRVLSDVSGVTKSEGLGYGMILTAYYGEKPQYDSLLAFYLSKRTTTSKGAMGWEATCSGWQDQGSATDGDLDAAYSCIVAYAQWGSNYLNMADTILNVLSTNYLVSCGNGTRAVVPGISGGSAWGGCTCTDISYYTPAYWRLFAIADKNTVWNAGADSVYRILNACANATTGLVPDWQAYNGTPGGSCGRAANYGWDACRVPWRMAIDYLWNGNTNARDWCVKVTNWANGVGVKNIKSGYSLSGAASGTYHNSSFVGAFAVGSMCNTQAMVDAFSSEMKSLNDQDYYNLSLKAMYMLVVSGNLWQPNLGTGVSGDTKVAQSMMRRPAAVVTGTTLAITGLRSMQSLSIVTPSGKLVRPIERAFPENARFNVSSLSRGTYIARISSADGDYTIKFFKP